MADNYLEKHYEDYLKRKAAWERSHGRNLSKSRASGQERPDDEAL